MNNDTTDTVSMTIEDTKTSVGLNIVSSGGGESSDYNILENKPQINDITLIGNKSLNDLGIQPTGNYVEDENYVHTDNNYTTAEKTKLGDLPNIVTLTQTEYDSIPVKSATTIYIIVED